jgi:hypothetical protein
MECSIQRGDSRELNGTFHLSPNENILTIARINIRYLLLAGAPCAPDEYRFRHHGSPISNCR